MEASTQPRGVGRLLGLLTAGALAVGPVVAVAPAAFAEPAPPPATAEAKAKKKPAPKKSQLSYSLAAKRYTGKAQKVKVTAKVAGMGKITVYYQGTAGTKYTKTTTAPKKIGSYKVSVKVAAGKKYRAATLKLGTMKIVREWKITYNANGGKIGAATSKSVYVKNAAKLGKLPTATRSGYIFQGWYTKKAGGSKATTATKATKNATYYARWKAKPPIDANLIGRWNWTTSESSITYFFYADGTYEFLLLYDGSISDICMWNRGDWSASAGVMNLSNREKQIAETWNCATANVATIKWGPWSPLEAAVKYYLVDVDDLGAYALIEEAPLVNGTEYFKFRYTP